MTKKEIRSLIKSRIPSDKNLIQKESLRICKKIEESEAFKKAPLILAYMALSDEVDLQSLIFMAFEKGKSLALPRIISGSNIMEFYRIDQNCKKEDGLDFLIPGDFNIREPEANQKNLVTAEELPSDSLILVPGRAFTSGGKRLGRGKGFYDIWLSKIPEDKKNRVHLTGVCFPQQIVDELPCDEGDILMKDVVF